MAAFIHWTGPAAILWRGYSLKRWIFMIFHDFSSLKNFAKNLNMLETCWEHVGTCWKHVGNMLETCWKRVGIIVHCCKTGCHYFSDLWGILHVEILQTAFFLFFCCPRSLDGACVVRGRLRGGGVLEDLLPDKIQARCFGGCIRIASFLGIWFQVHKIWIVLDEICSVFEVRSIFVQFPSLCVPVFLASSAVLVFVVIVYLDCENNYYMENCRTLWGAHQRRTALKTERQRGRKAVRETRREKTRETERQRETEIQRGREAEC